MEEAIQAKTGLDKSPSISGVLVSTQFASEANIKDLCEQFQGNAQPREQNEKVGWPGTDSTSSVAVTENKASHPTTTSSSSDGQSVVSPLQWGDGHYQQQQQQHQSSSHFSRQQSSEMMSIASTPGSASMWSDGGFLSGFSSPWVSSGPSSISSSTNMTPSGGGPTSMTPSGGGPMSMTSPQESAASVATAGPPVASNGQSFLPGGLL